MYRRFQNRFGTAGVIVAVVALIAALSGTALAASGALTGKQKKEVEKIAKKFQGTGPAGANGTNGANGKDGANGANGAAGAPGASVTNTKLNVGNAKCSEGGAEFKVGTGTATTACNGEPGATGDPGPPGSPWTAGGTLPPGATETGTWALNATTEDTAVTVPISFPIQLAQEAKEGTANFQDVPSGAAFSAVCKGSVIQPTAPAGHLCVYYGFAGEPANASFEFITDPSAGSFAAGVAGALLHFGVSGSAHGFGTWAVTGCSESLPVGNANKCPE